MHVFYKKISARLLNNLRKLNTGFLRPKKIDKFIWIKNKIFTQARNLFDLSRIYVIFCVNLYIPVSYLCSACLSTISAKSLGALEAY